MGLSWFLSRHRRLHARRRLPDDTILPVHVPDAGVLCSHFAATAVDILLYLNALTAYVEVSVTVLTGVLPNPLVVLWMLATSIFTFYFGYWFFDMAGMLISSTSSEAVRPDPHRQAVYVTGYSVKEAMFKMEDLPVALVAATSTSTPGLHIDPGLAATARAFTLFQVICAARPAVQRRSPPSGWPGRRRRCHRRRSPGPGTTHLQQAPGSSRSRSSIDRR